MRRYYNRSRLLPGLVVGIVVGIFIVVLLILLSSASSSDPDLASDSETQDTTSDVICEVEIAGERMVFDEPANPTTRVAPLEQGIYRVVAFSMDNWVSVDWNNLGLDVVPEELLLLDWIQLEEGLDILVGDCDALPRLGLQNRSE